MMPAAKTLDPVLGIDFHLIQPPGAPPVLLPHPAIGFVLDPFDFIPKLGADVFVNGLPRARAGTFGLMVPHFPLGGTFVKPIGNEMQLFMGSKIVSADGDAFSYLGLPALSCQCIGLPPIPRKAKKPSKKLRGLVLPTSVVLAIPCGVFVGGPPTISLMALAFRAGLGLAGKFLRGPGARLWKALSSRARKLANKLWGQTLKLGNSARNAARRAACVVTGHPVDVASGKLFTDFIDLSLPGPLPFELERVWYSTSTYRGPFGHGWHHSYDSALYVTKEIAVQRLPDGRMLAFPPLAEGDEYFDRQERVTIKRDASGYLVQSHTGLTQRFAPAAARAPELPADVELHVLREVVSRAGHAIRLGYDAAGRLSELRDSAGRPIRLEYDAEGRIVALRAPNPEDPTQLFTVCTYAYDELGNLATVTDALGASMHYRYEGHLLVRETDRSGLSFYFEYDGRDENARCTRTWGDGGLYYRELSYAPGVTRVRDSGAHETVYEHDGARVLRVTDPHGAVTSTLFENGDPVQMTDALGRVTRFTYDERGNLLERVGPDGAKLSSVYDERDLPIEHHDALGGKWQLRYDAFGQLIEHRDPLGATTRLTYARGLLVEVQDANGGRSLLEYDSGGNVVALFAPDGSAQRWRYNALGWPLEEVDANGNTRTRRFDVCGRVLQVREPDGNVRTLDYDASGNLLRLRDSQQDIAFAYQGMGCVSARTQAGVTVRFEYDTEERLTAVMNEHGAVYRFERDALGFVSAEHGFDGARAAYEYDALGRLLRVRRARGIVSEYEHDAADRVVAVRHSDGSEQRFAYRADGALLSAQSGAHRIEFERDALGRVRKEQSGDDFVASDYDPLGQRVRVHSSRGLDQRIERGPGGDVSAVRSAHFEAKFTRDALGLELSRALPGGAETRWRRDQLGRPLQHEIISRGETRRARAYHWAVDSRLRRLIDAASGPTDFHHDGLGQLALSARGDGEEQLRVPDAVGNLFRRRDRSDRRYGPAGQLLQSVSANGNVTYYDYDAEGHLIEKRSSNGASWRYRWNAAGHLEEVTRPDAAVVRFEYDALGRRVAKHYRGQVTRWLWNGDLPLHEWVEGELEPSPADAGPPAWAADTATLRREAELAAHLIRGPPQRGSAARPITWLFEPDSFAPMAKLLGDDAQSIACDHVGAPLAMLDAHGELTWSGELDSWGELSVTHGARHDCPFRWPGQYEDAETGLYYNRFRYYDPDSGQYTSQDPLGLAGGFALYGYVRDPLTWVDPLGLSYGEAGTRAGAAAPRMLGPARRAKEVRASAGPVRGGWSGPSQFRFHGNQDNAARIPTDIAARLRGRIFDTFDDFRNAFWKEIAGSPHAMHFKADPSNIYRMRGGYAPLVHPSQSVGKLRSYVLHHQVPIHVGGAVYDIDNILIVTPRFHAEILDPVYHFGR